MRTDMYQCVNLTDGTLIGDPSCNKPKGYSGLTWKVLADPAAHISPLPADLENKAWFNVVYGDNTPPQYKKFDGWSAPAVDIDARTVTYTPVFVSLPLSTLRSQKYKELGGAMTRALESGTIVNGKTISTTDTSIARIITARDYLAENGGTINFVTTAKDVIEGATVDTLIAMANAVVAHQLACYNNETFLHKKIKNAKTANGIMSTDVNSGWPT